MAPQMRQQRDVDSEADYGEVAVHQPPQNLQRLQGPRPSVDPGGLGGDQLVLAAASCGSRAPQPPSEAVHLKQERRTSNRLYFSTHTQVPQCASTFAGEMS